MNDHATTWMGVTLTHEFIAKLKAQGLNPWLTVLSGYEVKDHDDDTPRN